MGPTSIIWGLVDGVEAVLDNEVIFLEPYVSRLSHRTRSPALRL